MWILVLAGAALLFGGTAKKALAADPVIEMLQEKGLITEDEAQKLYDEKAKAEPVLLKNAGSQLKLDGRIFIGYFDSQKPGSTYEHGSFEIPDGKIRFTWTPKQNVEVVTRLSIKFKDAKADVESLDYFYGQINGVIPVDRNSRLRLGKIKVDFGEEIWTDNPVENTAGLISNSAGLAGGYDEGLELYGHFVPGKFGYSLSVANGEDGDGASKSTGFGYAAKLFFQPCKPFYASASYYTAERIKKGSKSALKVAGLQSEPAGTTVEWDRNIWQIDVRYQVPGLPVRVATAYGQFSDQPDSGSELEGEYYYLEGKWDITPEFFAGARYSIIKLDNNAAATLNDISSCNEYTRTSLGVGYNLNKLVTLKAEYSWNENNRPGLTAIDDNQFALGLAAKF